MEQQQHPWDRQDGEPAMWFERFTAFRRLGPARSIERAYRSQIKPEQGKTGQKRAARHWFDAADEWAWKARAEAWDKYEHERFEKEFAGRRQKNKAERIRQLESFQAKLSEAVLELTAGSIDWKEAISGLKMVTEQLRAEYDDLPTQSHNIGPLGAKELLLQRLSARASTGAAQGSDRGPSGGEGT